MRTEWQQVIEGLDFIVARLRPGHAKASAALIDLWLRRVREGMRSDVALQVAAHCAAFESRGLAELIAFCGPAPDDAMQAAIRAAEADAKKSIAALQAQAAAPRLSGRDGRLDNVLFKLAHGD